LDDIPFFSYAQKDPQLISAEDSFITRIGSLFL
jgi:hypothetical protein